MEQRLSDKCKNGMFRDLEGILDDIYLVPNILRLRKSQSN